MIFADAQAAPTGIAATLLKQIAVAEAAAAARLAAQTAAGQGTITTAAEQAAIAAAQALATQKQQAAAAAQAAALLPTEISGQTILLVAATGLAAWFGIKKLREKN